MLMRIAASYEADPAWRQDLIQEISVSLWRALPSFRGEAGLRTYIARIAHNRAVDHILRQKRVREKAYPGAEIDRATGSSSQEDLHRRMDLVSAMRHIPLAYRQVLTLLLEGFQHAEIADALGLEENAVAQRISRGRRKLKQLMDGGQPHDR